MAVQGHTALLLLVTFLILEAEVFVKAQGKYDCQRLDKLEYCRNSSRIRVIKDKKDYRVRFCGLNGECMSDSVGDMNLRIRCSDVCDICKSLPGQNDCKEDGNCEEEVDKFFDDYCLRGNTATALERVASSNSTDCPPSSQVIGTGSQVSPEPVFLQTATSGRSGSESIITALGALFGLTLLLLALVITGWACTCVLMKKRGKSENSEMVESTEQNRPNASESIHKDKIDDDDDDDEEEEERYFKNPTYEGTSMNKDNTLSPTYESVNLSDSTKITIENEQVYAVPDKQWKANGTYIF